MKYKGFALIELIVVITIISALTAIAISNFPKIKLQFSLLRVTHSFVENLRKTQQMALSAVPYKNSLGVEREIDGYGVYLDLNVFLGNKKYIIYADKSPGNKEYDSSDYLVETIDFNSSEPGVKIKEVNNVSLEKASINFNSSKIETTITQLNQGQNSVEFVFSLDSDSAVIKTVSVNTSGLIEIK